MTENNKAIRYNAGKPQYSIIDYSALEPMVRVLEFGAKKYARDDWRKGLDKHGILDSLARHVGELIDAVNEKRDETDHESHQPIIGHILCNAMFYSKFYAQEKQNLNMGSLDNFNWDADKKATQKVRQHEGEVKWFEEWAAIFDDIFGYYPLPDTLETWVYAQGGRFHEDGEPEEEPTNDIDEILERGAELERAQSRPQIKAKPILEKFYEEYERYTPPSKKKTTEPSGVRGLGFKVRTL